VSAACNPDIGLIFSCFYAPSGINLEKLRMQRPLKEAESQFLNGYIDLRPFHYIKIPKQKNANSYLAFYYTKNGIAYSSALSVLIRGILVLIGRLFHKLRRLKD
jgi:hypothetical protein